jgi:hypothetical protein
MERDLTVMVVWVLFASSVIQAAIHYTTWWVLHRQHSQTPVGTAINRRELSLAIKITIRSVFDLLLAVLVTWQFYILDTTQREWLFAAIAIASVVAVWYGARFLMALWKQQWGQPTPEAMDARAMRQDHREVDLDTRAEGLDQRGVQLDRRGWDMSKESLRVEGVSRDQTTQQGEMDTRDTDQDKREVVLDDRDKLNRGH